MERCEVWAVPRQRIVGFFRTQEDVVREQDHFRFRSCVIILEDAPDKQLGALRIPRTRITFRGSEEDTQFIYHRFFMRFVSAGG